jgi:GNAT superfamily N-acetyltransferase
LPFIRKIRWIGSRLLPYIQGFKAYRNLAKRLIRGNILYQTESHEACEKCILVTRNGRLVGRITVNNFLEPNSKYNGWWILGTWVNWRYRGLGIGKRLTRMACDVAAKGGASEVKLLVFRDNKPATSLYQKIGFYQISIPEIDEQLREEAKETRRNRIIMAKGI